ncbi:hypothetical protein HOY80DRAFT_1113462 [Tuber brumale]|nr:hypothetical protein HOY80DRAFT_1113462 [Tuber brumale]
MPTTATFTSAFTSAFTCTSTSSNPTKPVNPHHPSSVKSGHYRILAVASSLPRRRGNLLILGHGGGHYTTGGNAGHSCNREHSTTGGQLTTGPQLTTWEDLTSVGWGGSCDRTVEGERVEGGTVGGGTSVPNRPVRPYFGPDGTDSGAWEDTRGVPVS